MTAEMRRSMLKPRLQRLTRIFASSPLFFVTLCTHTRRPLLADEASHQTFRTFCAIGEKHGVLVGRYVLMPDHIHLFVMLAPGSTSLSSWIKSLKNTLSKNWRTRDITAPHWQKGFFDHLLRSAESYSAKWDYVAANPVRAGLVNRAEDWPWSGVISELAF